MVYYNSVFVVYLMHAYYQFNKLIKTIKNTNYYYYANHGYFPRFKTKNRGILYSTEFNQTLSFNEFHIVRNHSFWVSYHLDRTIIKLTPDYYYLFVSTPGLMMLIYMLYVGHHAGLTLSSGRRLRSFIEEMYYRTLRESVQLTKNKISLKNGLNSQDEIENFLIITHTDVYNSAFNGNFKKVDVFYDLKAQKMGFNMQRITIDSFKWSEGVVKERRLTEQNLYDLAQLRIDLNLIESIVYKDYFFEKKMDSALKEATKECINFYLSMKGLK